MEHAPVTTEVDGFGRRTNGIDSETGDEVELLDLSPQLVEHSGFVTAVGERVARFATVRHASYVHLRRLDRPAADRLELVSDHTPGWLENAMTGFLANLRRFLAAEPLENPVDPRRGY